MSQSINSYPHQKLSEFLDKWPIERLKTMTLEEYTGTGDKETFCYWLEFETEVVGRIGGKPSNKFMIWKKGIGSNNKPNNTFNSDEVYKWYSWLGENAEAAFETVRRLIVEIASNALNNSSRIDSIRYDKMVKWKIAFMYSNYSLLPIFKTDLIIKLAELHEMPNRTQTNLGEIHDFLLTQKESTDDFFEFSLRNYLLAKKHFKRNYYIIGSKYEDDDGENRYNIFPEMLSRNAISTGFLWDIDLSHLYGKNWNEINKWIDKNVSSEIATDTAKRTIRFFLNVKPGDIIAIKSHGQYGNLTIIAYAEVKSVNGKVYEFDGYYYPKGLGHIINAEFLDINLNISTGLSYGQTIHHIIPGAKPGHFEKIFGTFSTIEKEDELFESDEFILEKEFSMPESRINEKSSETSTRTVSYSATFSNVHNKIQIAFAKYLKVKFPNDSVRTEHFSIDVRRENETELFLYEIKPYNKAYSCIREGIGQLLDYCHKEGTTKKVHLRIVGSAALLEDDLKFIKYLKESLNLSFDYIQHVV